MKKIICLLLSVILILMFICSCKDKEDKQPSEFSYRMDDFKSFNELLNKKELSSLKDNYKITITGLKTPVVFEMEGKKVLSVTAYDKTAEVNIDTYNDYCPASIEEARNAVIIREDLGYKTKSWIIAKDKIYTLLPDGEISTKVYAKEDGSLGYFRYWEKYETSLKESDTAPLEICSSRKQFLYEEGYLEIIDGRLLMTSQKTVRAEDKYDLDSLFKEAKKNGKYAEYNTLDELLKTNSQKKQEG